MTVEMIDKMGLTYKEWLEILSLCELLFNGLCETYCQRKRPEQQWLAWRQPTGGKLGRLLKAAYEFDKKKNFCYNIIVERQKSSTMPFVGGNPPFISNPIAAQFQKFFKILVELCLFIYYNFHIQLENQGKSN